MATNLPMMTLTYPPQWQAQFDEIKRDMFVNSPKADVIRYLIDLGLKKHKELKAM